MDAEARRIGGVRERFVGVGFAATFSRRLRFGDRHAHRAFIAAASPTRHNHAATLVILMSFTHTLKLAAFALVGLAIGAYLPLMVR